MATMTLQEIEAYPSEVLTPSLVAPVIGTDQQTLRMQARERPDLLGFPVICVGTRVKIPKAAFLRFMKGIPAGAESEGTTDDSGGAA